MDTIVVGVFRYKRIVGPVYSQYNEHTKKLVGLTIYTSGNFVRCKLGDLVKVLNDESKGKKSGKRR